MSLTPWLDLPGFRDAVEQVVEAAIPQSDEGFVSAAGAADYLGISRKALYALVERGSLPHHKPAGRLLFDRRELRAWVVARR